MVELTKVIVRTASARVAPSNKVKVKYRSQEDLVLKPGQVMIIALSLNLSDPNVESKV